jgi:hypothetical protein
MLFIRGFFAFGLVWLCVAAPAFGQNGHLLVTEFVVTPTNGEFIEIFNPTSATVDLSQYYLTDDIAPNKIDYVKVVNGAGALSLSIADFLVKFPDGANIAPGETQTIAFMDTAFARTYSKSANYEVTSSNDAVPNMVEISIKPGTGFLTNGSETIVLFAWDGASDLVQDVDYLVWGNKGTAVDKSGLAIDGPDADSDVSTYQNDTAVANQSVVNTDNDADPDPHDFGDSAQRVTLEVGETLTGGNGITGHDETSENLSIAGGSWALHAAPTPGSVPDALKQQPTNFVATLNGDQEVPPISTPAKGQITATLTGDQLVVTGSFSNLSSDFNAAVRGGSHLHLAPAGRNGGIQIELAATVNPDNRSGTYEAANNTFTLSSELVTALNERKLYANIHTQTYGGGEIRGQLVPEAEAYYRANLAGSNEVPSVSSTGNGGIILELRGDELTLSGSFKELGSDFNPNVRGGAHIHLAPAGQNGGIQLELTTVLDADLRGGVFEADSNTFTLTPELLTALQERRLYANVHTTTFGGGEIRGQILPQAANAFRVNFSGGNELPPVATTGGGALMLELAGDQLTVSGAFSGLSSDFNAAIRGGAHLHLAPIGRNGGIQIELAATVNADNRSGTFAAANNTFTLSTDLVTALRSRKLYANIHTQTFTGGEIRGQVLPENYSFFTAALSARNEVQPVASTARGGVIAELSGARMTLTGSFSDLISDFNPNVRGGAHLHVAPAGQNGGIQIELVTALDANARGGVFEAASNTFTLTAEQVTALRTGGMYANVHTQTFGSGETRGQLLADPNRFPNATTITSPASGSTVVIEGSGETLLQATWNAATDPDNNTVVYLWQLAVDRQFNALLVNRNTNTTTSFSAKYSDVDSILAAAGVAVGNTVKVYHRVTTSDGSLQSPGTIDSVNVTRGVIFDINFTATLTGDQEVPPVSTPACGQITATLTGDQLVVTGSFSNLSSDFNAAVRGGSHLHLAPAGRNGGIQIELAATVNPDNRSGTYEAANNTFTLSSELVTALNERKLYANIHTQTYGGGEIRGQLVPEAEAYYRANLAGSNEVPSVSSTGNGGIILELRGDELTLSGSFKELGSDFNPNVRGGAHIHLAPAGQNGGIQLELTTVLDADLRGGVFEADSNTFTLTPELLTALQERRLYANVHTTTFGGGEIRGQILPQAANAFRVNFSGGNELPPVATTGGGALMLELAGDQLTVSGAFSGLSSDFNAAIRGGAHLHLAPIGRNGGIQIELAATVNADNRSGTFAAANNTFTLSTDLVTALRSRKLYANIHTQTFTGGEIRGQVLPENYSFFTAALSARNEVQPVASTARGGVIAELSGARMTLTGSFSDLISDFNPNVRGGAHLHVAPAGQNGGIQIELVTALDANARGGVFEAASNTFTLTAEQVTALRTGGMYANVHTQTFGSGETRGQLLADPNRFPNATTITSPASGSTVVIEGSGETLLQATWNAATDPDNNTVVYLWQLAVDRQFNALLVNRNTNTTTSFSAKYSDVDSILAAAGVAVGNTVKVYHRAISSDGSLQTASTIDSVNITRGMVVTVEERTEALPAEFALHGNYPNPFNPSTVIRYDLPRSAHVKLVIYSVLGKVVRTLVDAKEAPGFKRVTWDGANDAGERVTSGIYVYRLETEGFTAVSKLTLLR